MSAPAERPVNPFAELWRLGYRRLVPVVPVDAVASERSTLAKRPESLGKAVGIRGNDGFWRGFDWVNHESTEADVERWFDMGAGVGIKTGEQPDGTFLIGIDADTLDDRCAAIVAGEIRRRYGIVPSRIGRAPKILYVVRVDGPVRYARVEFGNADAKGNYERVELLSGGRQFVAHGVHPVTRAPYRWVERLVPFGDLPVWPAEALSELLSSLRELLPNARPIVTEGSGEVPPQESLRGSLELVRKAVACTPNTSDRFPSRDSWRDYGYAIKASLPDNPDEALQLFQEWSARWDCEEGNAPGYVESEWRRMKGPFKRGANWLFELAEKAAPEKFSRAEQWFEEIPDRETLFPDDGPLRLFGGSEVSRGPRPPMTFVPIGEAAASALEHSTKPLVKGLLDQGAMTILYGESNTGKTFVAMDIAFHIAAGRPWGGMKVERMAVVYVAAEGGVGARKRAAAIVAKYGPNAAVVPLLYLLSPVDLLKADADVRPLIEAIRAAAAELGLSVGLVVIDTLSRAMSGGDENSSTDMGALVRHFDVIRAATGAHLLAVHHSGKDRAKGARGHSLLRAATDTEIEIADNQISVTKQRDLDRSFSSGFVLEPVVLGVDADGAPIMSCTVRLTTKSEVVVGTPLPAEENVLDAIKTLCALSPDPSGGVSVPDVVQFLTAKGIQQPYDTVRTHLRRLAEKSLVERAKRGKWAPCMADQIDPFGQHLVKPYNLFD